MGKARALLFFGIRVEEFQQQNIDIKDSGGIFSPESIFDKRIGTTNKNCEILCLTKNYLEDVFNYYLIVRKSFSEVTTGRDGVCLTIPLEVHEDWIMQLNNIAETLQIRSQPPSWFLYCEERHSCCS